MLISKTPLRISLCGGGTDYPEWFSENGGMVVGGTINHFSHVSARWLPPFHDFKSRIVYSAIETVNDNLSINHLAVRACLNSLNVEDGIELIHSCDIPGRSGTGSSSTFVVGLLKAISALKGNELRRPEELARGAIRIERDVLGETVGWQDQIWAAHGGLNVVKFKGDEYSVTPLTLSCSQVQDLNSHLLLFFTGVSRISSIVAASYAPKLATGRQEQFAMMRLAERAVDALHTTQWEQLGSVIDSSWRIKSSLSDKVSTGEISKIYSTARIAGAWGGKITGAGGGGCLILVAPPDKHTAIIQSLNALGCIRIPFHFTFSGSEVVFYGR